MKIAICFSGQPRSWEKCHESWFKFIEKIKQIYNATEVDIFCHAWDFNTPPNEIISGANHKGLGPKGTNEIGDWTTISGDIITEDEKNRFLNILKPKSYLFENEEKSKSRKDEIFNRGKFEESTYGEPAYVWPASQFYGVMRAAHLKKKYEFENGFKYDICIRLRYDLFFNDFEIEERIHERSMILPVRNTIHSCHTGQDYSIGFPFFRLGDIFWYAESVSFDRICDFYRFMPVIGIKSFTKNEHLFIEGGFYFYAKMLRLAVRSVLIDPKVYRLSNHLELKDKFGLAGGLGNHELI